LDTTTRFHIGAKALRGAIPAYAKRFDLLEVCVALTPGPKGKHAALAPNTATLKKWRKETPPTFEFAVIVGPHVARLKASTELEHELDAAKRAVDLLQARCLLVRTPPEVTPSALARDRLGKLFDRFPKDVTSVVWEPSGLWEIEDAAVAARKWGVVLAVDAAREPVPAGPIAYVRLRAMGETRAFGPSALSRIVETIGLRRDAYVILETDGALDECKRLRSIAQRTRHSGSGGMGRLVRPRGGIVVRDDEQE
jgi:uncharacterized protein YecE (DUF72 family)